MNQPVQSMQLGALVRTDACSKCKFAAAVRGEALPECRRNPPVPTTFLQPGAGGHPGFITHTGYARVNPDNWCGEFKPRIAMTQ